MIQPFDHNEKYLLRILKELPKVFKLQQNLVESMHVSDDDFDDRDLATAPQESNHADSSFVSLSADTDRQGIALIQIS